MRRKDKGLEPGEALFIGLDLHKETWHAPVRATDVYSIVALRKESDQLGKEISYSAQQ
jgi:hypothetical protein